MPKDRECAEGCLRTEARDLKPGRSVKRPGGSVDGQSGGLTDDMAVGRGGWGGGRRRGIASGREVINPRGGKYHPSREVINPRDGKYHPTSDVLFGGGGGGGRFGGGRGGFGLGGGIFL